MFRDANSPHRALILWALGVDFGAVSVSLSVCVGSDAVVARLVMGGKGREGRGGVFPRLGFEFWLAGWLGWHSAV